MESLLTRKEGNPEGIPSSSPGLAFLGQPWVTVPKKSNPKGVASRASKAAQVKPAQPFQGC
jgi:hypothetical protein